MAALEWIATGLCFGSLGGLSAWLLLDALRERRRARAFIDLTATYGNTAGGTVASDEETWPIVAQQPQKEFPNAATIRIPRQTVNAATGPARPQSSRHAAWCQVANPDAVTVPELLAEAVEAGDPLRLAWPCTDLDSAGQVQRNADDDWPTGVLPVIRDDEPYEVL
jgi:pimeloyl-ACP methyl ester carboxylesterase